jgi:hypothetical protein
MNALILSLVLLVPCALLAEDTFRMETRIVELAPDAPAPEEFPAADPRTPPVEAILKVGQQGRVEVGRTTINLRDVNSDAVTEVPLGIAILLTPAMKDGQLTYRAQVTHSEPIFSTRGNSAAEVATTTFYQSGACEAGKPVWFNYKHPANGKSVFVGLRLSKQAP